MSNLIYFDNAATTALDTKVLEAMMPYLTNMYGNPSSTYSIGRSTRIAIENARKTVAELLGVKSSSIYFTSGGTESNNTAIAAAIHDLDCTCIITSPIEHHAVLTTVENYSKQLSIPLFNVNLTNEGEVDYDDLEVQLKTQTNKGHKCLVSLMHANNEIGSLLDIKRVGLICETYKSIFHSDCVQTVGHYPLNLSEIGVHFISGASHKFHGPKGVGILYIHPSLKIQPLIYGGGQERNLRAGTENVYGIVGFAKALELAMQSFEIDSKYIEMLKRIMKQKLISSIPRVKFNGPGESLYTVLSVSFPKTEESDMLLLNLDMQNVCVSGGSACSSKGGGSHVIKAIQKNEESTTLRFSFCKNNTIIEIIQVVEIMKALLIPQSKFSVL